MINHETYFHLVEVEHKDPDFEMIATRTLATVYAKYKLNAWKMKNIPFGTHPLIVMSINVQPTRGNALAVAGVSTMNFYLNKFTCFIKLCQQETLSVCVEEAVRGCLEKFRAAHAKYPVRIMIFRSGYKSEEAGEEYQKVRNGILAQSGSLVTYIMLSKKHPLRTYIQIDANSANYHTVKKIQLLLAIVTRSRFRTYSERSICS